MEGRGRGGGRAGEGHERGWKGTDRGRGSLGTLILLVKQNYLWSISFDQELCHESQKQLFQG